MRDGAAVGLRECLVAEADAEQRQVALERPARQSDLEAVALGDGAARLGVRLVAVRAGIDVGAAGEDQPVDQIDDLVGI